MYKILHSLLLFPVIDAQGGINPYVLNGMEDTYTLEVVIILKTRSGKRYEKILRFNYKYQETVRSAPLNTIIREMEKRYT